MTLEACIEVLKEHPFLQEFRLADIEKLAALAQQVTFAPDEVIFREGAVHPRFYLLLSGRVALEVPIHGRVLRVQTLGPGEELGWSSMVATGKLFQARALEEVRALSFESRQLLEVCQGDHEFGFRMMEQLLQVVSQRLQATRLQLLDVYTPGGGRKHE
jgi:CRP-like cAMP-binding protein